jgi:hypothetical protein
MKKIINTHEEELEENVDYFEGIAFHPSLDIKNGILVLGFRIKPKIDKEENIILVITQKGEVQKIKGDSFDFEGKKYHIELKDKKLAKLSQKWSLKDFNATYNALSSDWKPLVKPNEVFTKLKELLKNYIDLPDSDYTLLSTWILGSYFFPIFSAYSYLHIKAPKGSGKTQCLSFINQTSFNAVKALATLPAMRDTVNSLRGTFLVDQADNLKHPNNKEFLNILTDSYKRGCGDQRKMVSDKGKNWIVQEFQTYGPKAFASIYSLPEDLRDRSLLIALTKSKKNFQPLDEENSIWKEMRGDLYKLLISVFWDVSALYELRGAEYRQNPTLFGRQLELWLPFEVIMTVVGVLKDEQELIKTKFNAQYGYTESQANELEKSIIETLLHEIGNKTELILSPKEIADKISTEIFESKDGYVSEKQKSAQVGKKINKFNLSTKKLPRNKNGERYLFTREQVQKVFDGYVADKNPDEHTPIVTEQKRFENLGVF